VGFKSFLDRIGDRYYNNGNDMRKPIKGLYKTPRYIGGECEGYVYRIGKNLIEKRWFGNVFGDYTVESIVDRIRITEKIAKKKIPVKLRKYVTTPEFVGYEKRRNDEIVTYHEYIKPEPVPETDKMDDIMDEIEKKLDGIYFRDMQFNSCTGGRPSNTIYSKGKFYLVDVAPEWGIR